MYSARIRFMLAARALKSCQEQNSVKPPKLLIRAAPYLYSVETATLIALLFSSFIPAAASSQLTGPYGQVQLQLLSSSILQTSSGGKGFSYSFYSVKGQIFIGGSWYYVNTTRVSSTVSASTFNQSTAFQGGSASATNSSASASASASASSSATASTTTSVTATSQSQVPAPVELLGYAVFYFSNMNRTVPLTFYLSNGTRVAHLYTGYAVNFTVRYSVQDYSVYPLKYAFIYVLPVYPQDNMSAGPPLEAIVTPGSATPFIDVYGTIVALPQFNDTMLGAWASKPSVSQPDLPLAPYYNLLALAGIIVLIPLSLVDTLAPGKNRSMLDFLKKVAAGVVIILLFPLIYDRIAYMMNTLNQMIIAYPSPYQDYGAKLYSLENWMIVPPQLTIETIIGTAILGVGYIAVTVITEIMNFLLGTIRILLIAGMIALFPLSVALRDFYYTQKLGRMIEDTLFGLMLATILSASMLGIAEYLLSNWSSPENMFRVAGIQPQWVAISAVLGALLAPTVLAPLVSTVYMAASDVASIAGGVATAFWFGGLSGGLSAGARAPAFATAGQKAGMIGTGALVGFGQSAISTVSSVTRLGEYPSALRHHELKLLAILGSLGNQRPPEPVHSSD